MPDRFVAFSVAYFEEGGLESCVAVPGVNSLSILFR